MPIASLNSQAGFLLSENFTVGFASCSELLGLIWLETMGVVRKFPPVNFPVIAYKFETHCKL
ncbi:hypothetical protein, partial [Candidatus Contendibacter odensensis]|uniref:hypothetical protein n=1 Tax=Candidatus Contendibacter odensensis TaxID=1400860 RepID=UPI001E45917F